MTREDVAKLEDAASAALAIRGDWERAYRRSRSQHNWRELQIADAAADRALIRLAEARKAIAAEERAIAKAAKLARQAERAAQSPTLF